MEVQRTKVNLKAMNKYCDGLEYIYLPYYEEIFMLLSFLETIFPTTQQATMCKVRLCTYFLLLIWTSSWTNNGVAGELRHNDAYFTGVAVMLCPVDWYEIHYTICRAVSFQFTDFPCDDWENIYTLSYYHQIGSMNYYPLFRLRSWNNGVRCIFLYSYIFQY